MRSSINTCANGDVALATFTARRRQNTSAFVRAACVALLALVGHAALADVITPTRAEWAAWPDYCKAKYVELGLGDKALLRSFRREDVAKWRAALGENVFVYTHHGCRGVLHMMRADALRGRDQFHFEYNLKAADSEAQFTLDRIPPNHFFHIKLELVQARVEYELRSKTEGMAALRQIMSQAPDNAEVYSTISWYLFGEQKLEEARDVLRAGMKAVPQPTAEMHYFYGLIAVKLKSWEEAREQAEAAYQMGYPLPGLRRQLEAAGHWTK